MHPGLLLNDRLSRLLGVRKCLTATLQSGSLASAPTG